MLFVGNRGNQPLTAQQASELMRGVQPGEIPGLVDALNHRYETAGCPYQIVSDRSGYRMTLRKVFSVLRDRFYGRIREARLSQAAVDVLAIVSYRQPITAQEIAQLRGRPSGRLLSQLVRRKLLQLQRPEGRQGLAQYRTADRFLELFGLQGLEDLPQSEDLD
jgi:segregation and condensation protein B